MGNLNQLIINSLPSDISKNEFLDCLKYQKCESNLDIAYIYALAKCSRINWRAYSFDYPDVKEMKLNPMLHFVKYGIFEGRKLKSWHPLYKNDIKKNKNNPLISIIIPNYNNELYLKKCINSLVKQSLNNIEIIIVDDCSTDKSVEIIKKIQNNDSRIKLIEHNCNMKTHMARKHGTLAANGDYIMYVDADDYLSQEGCQIAFEAIAKGYDIVSFCANVIKTPAITDRVIIANERWINRPEPGEYFGSNIVNMTFKEKRIPHIFWNKIFDRVLIQNAFQKMEDGEFWPCEDEYGFLVASHLARNMLHISDKIYNYRIGVGITSYDSYEKQILRISGGKVLKPLKKYCDENGLHDIYKFIKESNFNSSCIVIEKFNKKNISLLFEKFENNYGALYTICAFYKMYKNKMDIISDLIINLKNKKSKDIKIKKIGIFYFRISPGGIETTIQNLCRLLPKYGYEITLFLEEKSDIDLYIDPSIKKYYLAPSIGKNQDVIKHLTDLYNAVSESEIQLMFYMYVHESIIIWDTILLRMMNVDIIGSMRIDINFEYYFRHRSYRHSYMLNVLRSLDKVVCLNISTEIYLRTQGIDSIYIPNTIRQLPFVNNIKRQENAIAVVARLSDGFKKIGQCLKTLSELSKLIPDVQMYFVGDFGSETSRNLFYNLAKKLDVLSNLKVMGWTSNPAKILDSTMILFSASCIEGFPNNIAEAQSRGMPVVMYDLDISLAEDNESIIKVPQDDYKNAAIKIFNILTNKEEWQRLSKIAINKSKRFSDERFINEIKELIDSYNKQSLVRYYSSKQYNCAVHYMAYYAGSTMPPYFE